MLFSGRLFCQLPEQMVSKKPVVTFSDSFLGRQSTKWNTFDKPFFYIFYEATFFGILAHHPDQKMQHLNISAVFLMIHCWYTIRA